MEDSNPGVPGRQANRLQNEPDVFRKHSCSNMQFTVQLYLTIIFIFKGMSMIYTFE